VVEHGDCRQVEGEHDGDHDDGLDIAHCDEDHEDQPCLGQPSPVELLGDPVGNQQQPGQPDEGALAAAEQGEPGEDGEREA